MTNILNVWKTSTIHSEVQPYSLTLRTRLKATALTSTIFKMKGPQIVWDNWNNHCERRRV